MYFSYGDTEVDYLKRKDKRLGAAIDAIGHVERELDGDLFSSVVHHIIGQQISTKAQATVWKRLCDEAGGMNAESVGALDVTRLQSSGMTFRKAEHIARFSTAVREGDIDLRSIERMPDDEAIAALTAIPGIGVWTAEMILLHCLQRSDVLSFGDLAILRGMRMLYRHKTIDRRRFERYRKRFSPYGSVASIYLWAIASGAIPGMSDPAPSKNRKRD